MPDMAQEKVDEILNKIKDLPGYVYEMTANLGSERTLSIRGNFPPDVPLETLNKELDKLVRASDRQLSKACIASLEEDLAKQEQTLEHMKENVKAVQGKTKNYTALPPAAQAELNNAQINVKTQEAFVARKKTFLEKTRKDAE